MKIRIERSGGFAGMSSSNELDSDMLPPSIESTVRELLEKKKLPRAKGLGRRIGSADYLSYKISIHDGNKQHVIQCNELEMDSNVKSLVNYIKKNSKKN